MTTEQRIEIAGVEYEHVGADYLEKRTLQRKAGWVLLWGLGVGAVISGDYFGWNFGLTAGGFWGLAIATILMAIMYITMMYCLAELSTALPHAGGPYSFARQAMGPWGGYLTGLAVVIEYVITPAVIVVGIGGYLNSVFPGVPLWMWWVVAYAIFVGINIWGVELTLKVSLAVTLIATLVLFIFYVAAPLSGAWSWDKLFNIPPDPGRSATGLPKGWFGVFAALPFAIWFYLAIEELPLAAEEAENVSRDMPKAMLLGIAALVILSFLTLVFNSGVGGGAVAIGQSPAPLAEGFQAVFGLGATSIILTLIGLTGLIASFHSIIYAYARQIFALSRAGYFPRFWSLTWPQRHTPYVALIGGAILGLVVALLIDRFGTGILGAALLNMAVFGAVISYVLMMVSYIIIKRRMPNLKRPYVSPGGTLFAWIALILAALAAVSTLANPDYRPGVLGVAVFYLLGILYFLLWGRHQLVAEAPEEEFALIEAAQAELAH
ncbi:MAG: ethanolamine permease [Caldilineales bacterium]|nr:ethanolamine permease [Caldilineales bacterium]